MKVLIIGANGQIGTLLAQQLTSEKGIEPTAMIRKEDQQSKFEKMGVPVLVADLESSVEDLAGKIKGFDAMVFTAGSGGSTGADKTILVDLDGAVKMVEVAEMNNIPRFVMVSAIGANLRERWSDAIRHYHAAKHYADVMLEQSSLDYTIIRPGMLKNKPATGKVNVGEKVDRGPISRADVAAVIVEVLKNKNTVGKAFDLVEGETPIAKVVSEL